MAKRYKGKTVFVTGGTGYIGRRLIKLLLKNGCRVIALVRKGSEKKVPSGAETIIGNAFDEKTFQPFIPSGAVFVQLLGVAHPSPRKSQQFREIDLRSVISSAAAAANAKVSHFVYVSVSMSPSRIMASYQQVRKEGEESCIAKGLPSTFLRPWYVLGPGHWWPILLLPLYGLAELVPAWRAGARAKGLVTIRQMLAALQSVILGDPAIHRILEIDDIRRCAREFTSIKSTRQKPSYQ